MALYETINYDDFLANLARQDEEERLRQLREQASASQNKIEGNNGGLGGFLGGLVGGIGKGIGDVGKGVFDLIGTGVASIKDIAEGEAGTMKNQQEFKKWLHNTDSVKDAYAKSAGTALNAATTLATTAVPGLAGAGTAAGKALGGVAANTIGGAVGGVADELQAQGADASLESAANRAISGAAGGLIGGKVAGKVGNASSKLGSTLLNNRLATSTLGRGAIAGAAGGAAGAGTSAALGGGDITQAALQGGLSGAVAGGTQAGLMNAGRNIGVNARNRVSKMATGKEWGVSTPQTTDNTSRYAGMSPTEMLNTKAREAGFENYDAAVRRYTDSGAATKNQDIVDWMDSLATPQTTADLQTRAKTNSIEEPFMAYGESQLAKRTKGNQTAEALRRFGNSLEGAQTNVTRAAARDMGIDSTGKVIENVRKKTGLTNLETQAILAKELTGGADSLMDNIQRNALSATETGENGYSADTTKLLGEVEGIVRKYANRTNMKGEAGLNKLVDDVRNDIVSRDTDLLTKANNFKASAQELRGKGIVNPSEGDSAKAKIYSEIATKLDDLSYNAIPKENVDAMFGATISEMRARATQAQNNGNKDIANAYNTLADSLDRQPRTVKAYRSFKKDFVDVSRINQLTGQAENGAGLQLGSNAAGAIKRFGNTLLNRPINAGLAKAGGVVNTVANAVDTIGGNTTTGTKAQTQPLSADAQNLLGNFIGRTQGNIAANNLVEGAKKAQEQQNLEGLLTEIQNSENNINAINLAQQQAQMQRQLSPLQTQLADIENGMSLALSAGDLESYNTLASLYKNAYNIYQTQAKATQGESGSNMSTAEKNQIAKLQSAGTALDQLESLYEKAGGGQGRIAGNIANFLSGLGFNDNVGAYNQLAQGLINQIGAAIGKTDSLNTEGEVQRALSLVPKITDTAEEAKVKLSTLRQLLQTNTETYNQLYGA